MTEELVVELGRRALFTALELSLPVLAFTLIVGVVVSVLQAVTQIQDMTLALVPKILAAIAALLIFGPWMLHVLMGFATQLFGGFPDYIR